MRARAGWAVGAVALVAACATAPAGNAPAARPVAALAKGATAAPRTRVADAWRALCEGAESVPMEVAGSREFVEVTLPGAKTHEPLRFHVDTGGNTPGLLLPRAVAARLGFATPEAMPRAIRIGEREIALPEGASWLLLDDPVEAKLEATRKGFSVGQLGAGFLSRFVVCIDPGRGRLGLGDPRRFELESGGEAWVPLFFSTGGPARAKYPFVHAVLRDEAGAPAASYGLLLDTGATTSMLESDALAAARRAHGGWPTANGAFGDADMLGGGHDEAILRVPDVALGAPSGGGAAVDFGPARFVERPTGTWGQMFGEVAELPSMKGAVANDVLLRYRLLLDYPHARLYVEPSGRPPDASAWSSRVGVAVRFGDDGCPVVHRLTDTNAKETLAKLAVGDVLLAVDGKDACAMLHHELSAALAGPPGTPKSLRVRRGEGAPFDVQVATAELLPRAR